MLEDTIMPVCSLTDAKKRLLDLLKRGGPGQASALARRLRLTDVAVRQHLAALQAAGLVRSRHGSTSGRTPGRPAERWSLTDLGHRVFPDHHAELTVGLICAIRESVGERGLRRIVEVRARDQVNLYQTMMPPAQASLKKRVEALAAHRTREGYMAEVRRERSGTYLLIEHHCPICDAAASCTGLCQAEMDVFRRTLCQDVSIERI